MNYLTKYFLRIGVFLSFVVAGVIFLFPALQKAFLHNIWLNGMIISCFLGGVLLTLLQFRRLYREQKWLDAYEKGEEKFPGVPQPKILAPLALYLDQGPLQTQSVLSLKAILSSIEMRLEDSRDISRYLVGLMIFFGLLGTFWGLSQTIGAITGVIGGIHVGGTDIRQAFDTLKEGLQSPLAGMGTAFSCSMLGLASSMILGFLDLTTTKAGNAFFHVLEEKLTPLMREMHISEMAISHHTTTHSPHMTHSGAAYLQGLIEQTTESMAHLNGMIQNNEESRTSVVKLLQGVGEKMSLLTEQMTVQHLVLQKMAQNQVDLQEQIRTLTHVLTDEHLRTADDGMREYLRNLDTTALRLLEEVVEGRVRTVQELKNEIKLVARTISALAEGNDEAAA